MQELQTAKKLRTIIFCGGAPRHLFVANRLCESADVLAIVMESGSRITLKKCIKQAQSGAMWRKIWRTLRDRPRYAGNNEEVFFFADDSAHLTHQKLLHQVTDINAEGVLKLVRDLKPDVVAVFGTSLIKEPLLAESSIKFINLHGGLSPWYRGADCTFWALYHGEPERVGCTLHYINQGIDSGELIAHIRPEIRSTDDELTLFWRGVRDAADVYGKVLEAMAQGETFGRSQQEKGRLFQVKDRLWRHERRLNKNMRSGLLDARETTGEIIFFNDPIIDR